MDVRHGGSSAGPGVRRSAGFYKRGRPRRRPTPWDAAPPAGVGAAVGGALLFLGTCKLWELHFKSSQYILHQ